MSNHITSAENARRKQIAANGKPREEQAREVGVERSVWSDWLLANALATRRNLSAEEIARRHRVASSHFPRWKQAERVGIKTSSWLGWLSVSGLATRTGGQYPAPTAEQIAECLRVAALPIPRRNQAAIVGMSCNGLESWLYLRNKIYGDVPDNAHLIVRKAETAKRKAEQQFQLAQRRATSVARFKRRLAIADREDLTRAEQAKLAGISLGGWRFWLCWARGTVSSRPFRGEGLRKAS